MRFLLITIFLFFVPNIAKAETIKISDYSFHDIARERTVPYRLYQPKIVPQEGAPIIIFSHGLGGSSKAAPYFCKAMAEAGYFVFSIQHKGTDISIWLGSKKRTQIMQKFKDAIKDTQAYQDRMKDVGFVLDEIEKLNKVGRLKGRLNLNQIGLAGHSYGAKTALALSGQSGFNGRPHYKDNRIKASIALSPNIPMSIQDAGSKRAKDNFKNIDVPVFFITGTKDENPVKGGDIGETVKRRILSYEYTPAPDKFLLVLKDADHASFSPRRIKNDLTQHIVDTVNEGAVLFFDAYLRNDKAALLNLKENYKNSLKSEDRFEYK